MKNRTAKELEQYFKENYNTKSVSEMAKELGCSIHTIYTTANRLGIYKEREKNFTKEEIEEYLRRNINTKTINEIANELGYSTRQIFNLTKSLSLKKDTTTKKQKVPVKKLKNSMTETQYNVIKKALAEAKTKDEKKSIYHIAAVVGVGKYDYNMAKTKIMTSKDYEEFSAVTAKTSTKLLTEKQYNEVKRVMRNAGTNKEINAIAVSVGLNKNFYRNHNQNLKASNTYQEFSALVANNPKKKAREEAREQKALKAIRENTAKINEAIFKKRKTKNPPNQAVNIKKSGQTTRAIKALLEEAEKEKALKEYAEKLDSQLNAKENELSVNIRVQVGNTTHILKRSEYDTPEKIQDFMKKKREQQQKRIEEINQSLRKSPKQEF